MKFAREFELGVPPSEVWNTLWDIERMVGCVPGCTGAAVVEDGRRYQATIVEKVGPFKVEVPLDIEILEVDAGRSLKLRASGKDSRVGTEVSFVLSASLDAIDGRSRLGLSVDATVVGRLVSLGQAVIKLKGDQQLGKFADALKADLETRAAS